VGELRDFPYATFDGFGVSNPAFSDAPLDYLSGLLDEPAVLIGDDGSFLESDEARFLIVCEA
jgi:hypothetical protein